MTKIAKYLREFENTPEVRHQVEKHNRGECVQGWCVIADCENNPDVEDAIDEAIHERDMLNRN